MHLLVEGVSLKVGCRGHKVLLHTDEHKGNQDVKHQGLSLPSKEEMYHLFSAQKAGNGFD